jgi:hypothetical protein
MLSTSDVVVQVRVWDTSASRSERAAGVLTGTPSTSRQRLAT